MAPTYKQLRCTFVGSLILVVLLDLQVLMAVATALPSTSSTSWGRHYSVHHIVRKKLLGS